jgi:adenosine deaminase CECR1
MMKGLFAYESAFRNYTRECIKDFVKDNIQYAEIRPNFMSTNSLKTDDGRGSIGNEGIMKIIDEELKATMDQLRRRGEYFGGMKVIYCTPRSFVKEQIEIALDECIDLKKKYKDLLCGKHRYIMTIYESWLMKEQVLISLAMKRWAMSFDISFLNFSTSGRNARPRS